MVRSHGATVVLFGSIHLLPAGLDWRPAAARRRRWPRPNELWFELPIDRRSDNEAARRSSPARSTWPTARSLIAMLTPTRPIRSRRRRTLHLSADDLDRMQPWMAELTLSVADDAASGADAFNGVEDQIQAIAALDHPPRRLRDRRPADRIPGRRADEGPAGVAELDAAESRMIRELTAAWWTNGWPADIAGSAARRHRSA